MLGAERPAQADLDATLTSITDRFKPGEVPTPIPHVTSCPVTLPVGGVEPGGTRWTDSLYEEDGQAVGLWPDGVLVFEPGGPGFVAQDGMLNMKFFWWRPPSLGQLEITGRRVDALAPPAVAHIPAGYDTQFQAIGISFPTQGCWEVTGRLGESTLTFVTLILTRP